MRGRILAALALRILGSARGFSLLARLLANALGIRRLLSRRTLMLGAFRKLDPHVRAVLANGDALELAEKLREQVRAERAHVEVGVALKQPASHLAQARRLPVVLVVGDDVDDRALDLLDGQARRRAVGLVATRLADEQLKRGEDVARLAKRRGRLLLAHPDHRKAALADAARQAREIAVARHEAEALDRVRIEDVHRVDDHGRVGGVLADGVAELLNRRDGIVEQRVFPLGVQGARPVAVNALVGDGAVFRKLVENGLDVLR